MKKHIVIGRGEVGAAIVEILNCDSYDLSQGEPKLEYEYDVMHVCFPYSDSFVESVKKYKEIFKADLIVVHSTVPVGTCDPEEWVHSPIRGVHPNMVEGVRTFVKYFGGKRAPEASFFFAQLGIDVKNTQKAADCEALKLWDTTQYGMMIVLQKQIYAYCRKHGLDFDVVYTDANHTYDIGYEKLNRPEVARPYLKHVEGPIGGHCVVPNCDMLDHPIADQVKAFDELLRSAQVE